MFFHWLIFLLSILKNVYLALLKKQYFFKQIFWVLVFQKKMRDISNIYGIFLF